MGCWIERPATDGEIVLTIDGSTTTRKTGIENAPLRIDEVRIGPQSVGSSISGTEFYDDFVTVISG